MRLSTTDPLWQDLKRRDPERFATLLFAPPARQAGLACLYGFNLELASIRERAAREPMAGHIRLQWWRDSLSQGGGGVETAIGVLRLGLEVEELLALVDAREADLSPEAPASLSDLEAYARATGGRLAALAARYLDGDDTALETAARAGTAYALQGLMRAIPAHAAMGRRHLPLDMYGDAIEAPAPGLGDAVAKVAALAGEHLAGVHLTQLPKSVRASSLCALQATTHLKRLRRSGFNPFEPRLSIPATRPLALWWISIRP
jgi:phytoene synthase